MNNEQIADKNSYLRGFVKETFRQNAERVKKGESSGNIKKTENKNHSTGTIDLKDKTLQELKKCATQEKEERGIKDINVHRLRREQLIDFLLKIDPNKYCNKEE